MSDDRVTYNEPGEFTGSQVSVGMVDEIVLSDATVHLEMLDDDAAFLTVRNSRRCVTANIYVRLGDTGKPALCVRVEEDLLDGREHLEYPA